MNPTTTTQRPANSSSSPVTSLFSNAVKNESNSRNICKSSNNCNGKSDNANVFVRSVSCGVNDLENGGGKAKYPRGLMPLKIQIAGHGSEGDGHRAILKREDGKLLKPVQAPPKGVREVEFYESINKSKEAVDLVVKRNIPTYYGIERVGVTNGVTVMEEFLVLRDITEGFELPNVMDVKIGAKTWGPDATEKKIAQESSKYVGTKGPLGFSVLGMIIHNIDIDNTGSEAKMYEKSFGKNLKTEDVHLVPEIFFDDIHDPPVELIEVVVDKMSRILEDFESQRKYKIFASSLLLSYDAAAVRRFKKSGSIGDLQDGVSIRLIDFAHVFMANGERDDNFLFGLNNLLALFTSYLNKKRKNKSSIVNVNGKDQD